MQTLENEKEQVLYFINFRILPNFLSCLCQAMSIRTPFCISLIEGSFELFHEEITLEIPQTYTEIELLVQWLICY